MGCIRTEAGGKREKHVRKRLLCVLCTQSHLVKKIRGKGGEGLQSSVAFRAPKRAPHLPQALGKRLHCAAGKMRVPLTVHTGRYEHKEPIIITSEYRTAQFFPPSALPPLHNPRVWLRGGREHNLVCLQGTLQQKTTFSSRSGRRGGETFPQFGLWGFLVGFSLW